MNSILMLIGLVGCSYLGISLYHMIDKIFSPPSALIVHMDLKNDRVVGAWWNGEKNVEITVLKQNGDDWDMVPVHSIFGRKGKQIPPVEAFKPEPINKND